MAERAARDQRPRLIGPASDGLEAARTTFPQPQTSFVGRTAEIAAVEMLFTDSGARLVTLTGPGGIGKTRLAFEYQVPPLALPENDS